MSRRDEETVKGENEIPVPEAEESVNTDAETPVAPTAAEAGKEETPAAGPPAAEAESDEQLKRLEAIDQEVKESGCNGLVEELEYVPQPKRRRSAAARKEEGPDLEISSVAEARSIIEAYLFSTNEPLPVARLSRLMNNLHPRTIRGLLLDMQIEYENRACALHIVEVAGGFQMATRPHLADWVFRLHKHRRRNPLTTATLETLAIVAYKQPVTKAEVETIRGVESTATIHTLLDVGLIEVSGRREVLGRPQLYSTTPLFLKTFGLRSLGDLPSIHELKQLFADQQKLKVPAAPEAQADKPTDELVAEQDEETVPGEEQTEPATDEAPDATADAAEPEHSPPDQTE